MVLIATHRTLVYPEMIHQLCNHGAMCSDHNHWLTEMIQHYGNHGDMLSDHNHWLTDDIPRCDV
jgi:hypothetical protein